MNFDTSIALAYVLILLMLAITLAGCGEQERFVKRLCLDMNGNEMECVHD